MNHPMTTVLLMSFLFLTGSSLIAQQRTAQPAPNTTAAPNSLTQNPCCSLYYANARAEGFRDGLVLRFGNNNANSLYIWGNKMIITTMPPTQTKTVEFNINLEQAFCGRLDQRIIAESVQRDERINIREGGREDGQQTKTSGNLMISQFPDLTGRPLILFSYQEAVANGQDAGGVNEFSFQMTIDPEDCSKPDIALFQNGRVTDFVGRPVVSLGALSDQIRRNGVGSRDYWRNSLYITLQLLKHNHYGTPMEGNLTRGRVWDELYQSLKQAIAALERTNPRDPMRSRLIALKKAIDDGAVQQIALLLTHFV